MAYELVNFNDKRMVLRREEFLKQAEIKGCALIYKDNSAEIEKNSIVKDTVDNKMIEIKISPKAEDGFEFEITLRKNCFDNDEAAKMEFATGELGPLLREAGLNRLYESSDKKEGIYTYGYTRSNGKRCWQEQEVRDTFCFFNEKDFNKARKVFLSLGVLNKDIAKKSVRDFFTLFQQQIASLKPVQSAPSAIAPHAFASSPVVSQEAASSMSVSSTLVADDKRALSPS